jgi:hypothetical protein
MSNLALYSHLRWGLLSRFLPYVSPPKPRSIPRLLMRATRPAHLLFLNLLAPLVHKQQKYHLKKRNQKVPRYLSVHTGSHFRRQWSCYSGCLYLSSMSVLESSWSVMGHARKGKWRGNWRMEWVASTLHTTSQHGVSSITTDDAHTSAASIRLNLRPRRFKWTRPFRRKTKSVFCACAITFQTQSTAVCVQRLVIVVLF